MSRRGESARRTETADRPSGYRVAQVTRVTSLTPHMTRVTFTGNDLAGLVVGGPDSYIKLFFPSSAPDSLTLLPSFTGDIRGWYQQYFAISADVRPPLRTYTVRAYRPDVEEIDVDFVVHGDTGPATRWVQSAAPGCEVAFVGPAGKYAQPSHAEWLLLAGDESALPAIGGIVEGLAAGTHARVFVEVPTPDDEQLLHTAGNAHVEWCHRGASSPGERLLTALRSARLPAGRPYAWVAGEAGMVKQVRRHLVQDRGIEKDAITFSGYWRVGVSEEDSGRG